MELHNGDIVMAFDKQPQRWFLAVVLSTGELKATIQYIRDANSNDPVLIEQDLIQALPEKMRRAVDLMGALASGALRGHEIQAAIEEVRGDDLAMRAQNEGLTSKEMNIANTAT